MAPSEEQARCVMCGESVRADQARGFLAYLRGDTMRLLGDVCAGCKERLDQEAAQEEEDDLDGAE